MQARNMAAFHRLLVQAVSGDAAHGDFRFGTPTEKSAFAQRVGDILKFIAAASEFQLA